jgi:lipase chaperone LimK
MSFMKMSAIGAASAALFVIILIPLNENPIQTESAANFFADSSFPAQSAGTAQPLAPQNSSPVTRQAINTNHGVRLKTKSNQLIVTSALKDLFDFYLSSANKQPHTKIFEFIEADLQRQLPNKSLQQAMTILTDYFAYKESLVSFNQQFPAATTIKTQINFGLLESRNDALIALQDRMMTPHIGAIFFAAHRQLDRHTLAKAKILTGDLSEDGKQQALINLNAQLPFVAFQHQQRNQKQLALRQLDEQAAISAKEKYRQQAKLVGEAAADRLAELDRKRALWQQRLDRFSAETLNLQASGLASSDHKVAFQKLLDSHFQAHEQLRAIAMTR